jgi:FK506-binding nuclear protein
MAAIDPTEEPVTNGESHPRATLKLIRSKFPPDEDDDDMSYDSDDIEALESRLAMAEDDDDDDDDEDDEMVNGGPSDPERAKKLLREALSKAKSLDKEDEDVEPKTLQSGVNGIFKGKGKAVEVDDDDDGVQEFVVCTLDSKQVRDPGFSVLV